MRRLMVPLLVAALALALLTPADVAHGQEATGAAPAIPPIVWTLTAFPDVGAIAEPGRYTAQFLPDGTVSVRADCNWVSGFWSGENGALDITITTSTLVGCPPDSLEQPFVAALDAVTSYTVDGFTLVLSSPAGAMQFAPDMPAMA